MAAPAAEAALGLATLLLSSVGLAEGLESLGARLGLRAGVLGAVVFPLFTSLPELSVVAVSLATRGASGVAEGTVVGEPLVVSTAALPAAGGLRVDRRVSLPFLVFAATFPAVLAPRALEAARAPAAAALLAAYAAYVALARGIEEELRGGRLGAGQAAAVVAASVAGILAGSRLAVAGIEAMAGGARAAEVELSMLLVPAATALPESAAAVIWAYRGEGSLAASALIGEMVLYSTVYPAAIILATGWLATAREVAAVAASEASCAVAAAQALKGKISWPSVAVGLAGLAVVAAV